MVIVTRHPFRLLGVSYFFLLFLSLFHSQIFGKNWTWLGLAFRALPLFYEQACGDIIVLYTLQV